MNIHLRDIVLSTLSIVGLTILGPSVTSAQIEIGPNEIKRGTTIEVYGPDTGLDLQAIIDDIDDEAADNPYLIKLGPGEYTIEADITTSEGLLMAPYISIMGSGQGLTILKGAISSGSANTTSAIVSGASNAALTDLSVENTGGSSFAIAIYNDSANPRIERVTATASGIGGTFNYSVFNNSSSPSMTQVTATASGGSNNRAVRNVSSSPIMTQLIATASGDSSNNYGVSNSDSTSAPRIDASLLNGSTDGVQFNASTSTRITNTQVIGGIDANPAGTQCRDTYNEILGDVTC